MDSHRISRVPRYSGYPQESTSFHIRGCHLLRLVFPDNSTIMSICNSCVGDPINPAVTSDRGLGSSHFARHYFGNHYCFLFLEVLRWFSSLRSLCPAYVFSREWHSITRAGLPHSEIYGLSAVCAYPKLIAAYHVLHRLFVPRHPPCALSNLTENLLPHRQIYGSITKDRNKKIIIFSCQRTFWWR